MTFLLSSLALLTGIAGLFTYQWITFFPRLGIGYLYHMRWVRLGFAAVTLALAGGAYLLNPSTAQVVVLVVALLLALNTGANRASRVLVALDRPRLASADEADVAGNAPMLAITHNGESRAWPLSILVPHHLVNDRVGGEPVLAAW